MQSELPEGHQPNGTNKIKRKLPPPVFSDSKELKFQNDSSSHLGRKRSKPHVDGDWPTHIYISINLPVKVKSHLNEIVQKLIQGGSSRQWHSFLGPESNDTSLHLSLSRPIFLKTNERDAFLEQLRKAVCGIKLFEIHFATFSSFMNDDCSRGFLALEVGSGHSLLKGLLEKIDKVVGSCFQPKYYSCPRFHVSIAWCLMDQKCLFEKNPTNQEIINDLFMESMNNSSLDDIRKISWKIHDINVLIGKTTHQLQLET